MLARSEQNTHAMKGEKDPRARVEKRAGGMGKGKAESGLPQLTIHKLPYGNNYIVK